MISHKLNRAQNDRTETTDNLLRAVLRESVAGRQPSPNAWQRIERSISNERTPSGQVILRWLTGLLNAGEPHLVAGIREGGIQLRHGALEHLTLVEFMSLTEGRMYTMRQFS